MPKFRKKPVVIEAETWPADDCFGVVEPYMAHAPASKASVCCDKCGHIFKDHGWVATLEGGHIVCPGDRIIKGVKGEFYPCKPDIFEATYEPVEEKKPDVSTSYGMSSEQAEAFDKGRDVTQIKPSPIDPIDPRPEPKPRPKPVQNKVEKLLCEQADLLTTQAGLLAAHETRLGDLEDAVGHIQAGPHGEEA